MSVNLAVAVTIVSKDLRNLFLAQKVNTTIKLTLQKSVGNALLVATALKKELLLLFCVLEENTLKKGKKIAHHAK